jgi:hypothetical protein
MEEEIIYKYRGNKLKAVKDVDKYIGCKGCYFDNNKYPCYLVLTEMDAPSCNNSGITFREVV